MSALKFLTNNLFQGEYVTPGPNTPIHSQIDRGEGLDLVTTQIAISSVFGAACGEAMRWLDTENENKSQNPSSISRKCGGKGTVSNCGGRCKVVMYCPRDCQRQDWKDKRHVTRDTGLENVGSDDLANGMMFSDYIAQSRSWAAVF